MSYVILYIVNRRKDMSKTIQDYINKHPDKFESWHSEDNDGLDYWVYCRSPYFSPDMETQTIHEYTVKDTLIYMRAVIKGKYNGCCWEKE